MISLESIERWQLAGTPEADEINWINSDGVFVRGLRIDKPPCPIGFVAFGGSPPHEKRTSHDMHGSCTRSHSSLYDWIAWTGVWEEEVNMLPLSACRTVATVPYLMEQTGFRISSVA